MICGACQNDVVPLLSIMFPRGNDPAGMSPQKVQKCPACDARIGAPEIAAVHDEQLKNVPVQEEDRPVASVAPGKPQQKKAVPPNDILGMARQRLDFVRDRIEELRQYEAEEAMLVRMVDAAGAPALRVVSNT